MNAHTQKQPFHALLLLILAGEAVFILPFVLARIFRATFLDVFQIDNFQLGTSFSVYGFVALISYLFGGGIADRIQPRFLLAASLFLTGIGGFYMMTYPSPSELSWLFGYWGFTTIFLFWAAMIKATRVWGGTNRQGLAFGILDGGRGLVAASIGTIGLMIFSSQLSIEGPKVDPDVQKAAFSQVILTSSLFVILVGLLVLFWLKPPKKEQKTTSSKMILSDYLEALRNPKVWLLMIIVCCAYVGYKITDIFSLYAKEVIGFDEVESAGVGTMLLYLRPLVGVSLGLLADRFKSSNLILFAFISVILSAGLISSGVLSSNTIFLFFISVIIISIGIFALRTLYFSVMEEGQIPMEITGTAVGLISLIGYAPDIFAGPLIGFLLENSPGEQGHQHVFGALIVFSTIGLIAAIRFKRISKKLS